MSRQRHAHVDVTGIYKKKKILGMARCRKAMKTQFQLHDEAAFKHCTMATGFRNGFYERATSI